MTGNRRTLLASQRYCDALTLRTAKNFAFAFRLLPSGQRSAMHTLYAFMRITDDLADEPAPTEVKQQRLTDWEDGLKNALLGRPSHPIHPALIHLIRRYKLPLSALTAVIEGVRCDLTPVRYATFADLLPYCRCVASAVGICCVHIWGRSDPEACAYADNAGIAFQLTNILRDLGEDWANGRVYLPQEEWEAHGSPPESWAQAVPSANFRALMRFQVERARGYYRAAAPLANLLPSPGRAVWLVMSRTYEALLDAIEAREYDVFRERIRLSKGRKFLFLLRALPVRLGLLG